ncbi:hypothetical protein [Arthrobacter sp. NPDC057013]|uniref:hypothetical protein n=1 Tax=Arthrobacter sp. NPDC057013 TaxID=3345999 RepID=UPI0036292ACF
MRNLECLRGISTLTAFGLAVEIAQSRSQGPITKPGNGHARRLSVEAAWHHRQPCPCPSSLMRQRWAQAPPAAQARGDAGNRGLHERWLVYLEHRKRPVTANVAIARELAGWCWSLATMSAGPGQTHATPAE